MENNKEAFWLKISFDNLTEEIEITAPNDPLRTIVGKLVGLMNLPRTDIDGNPLDYHLGRKGANGRAEVLYERLKKEEKILEDYGVQCGDELFLTPPEPIPGAGEECRRQVELLTV